VLSIRRLLPDLAMVGLAQYDTLAGLKATPPYLIKVDASGPATSTSPRQAANSVLSGLFPAQRTPSTQQ